MTSSVKAVVAPLLTLMVLRHSLPIGAAGSAPSCLGEAATIVGTARDDDIEGTSGNDVIWGGQGSDDIRGRGGHDRICGGRGVDTVRGGHGNDRLSAPDFTFSALYGGPGNDVLTSRSSSSRAFGGRGHDKLRSGHNDGGPGRDTIIGPGVLRGRSGDDHLIGGSGRARGHEADDYFYPGPGNDRIDGRGAPGISEDIIYYRGTRHGVVVDATAGTVRSRRFVDTFAGNDYTIVGSRYADVFRGSNHADSFQGVGGEDRISGARGDDMLLGGSEADVIRGGAGDDGIETEYCELGTYRACDGPSSGDKAFGGRGNDRLFGEEETNLFFGGPGNDWLSGRDGDDVLRGGQGDDFLDAWQGDDVYAGGPGKDIAGFTFCSAVHASLIERRATGCGSDVLEDMEGLTGSEYGDELIGDEGNNFLHASYNRSGSATRDVLVGNGGDDLMTTLGDYANNNSGETYEFDGGGGFDTVSFAGLWHDWVEADLATGTGLMKNSGPLAVTFHAVEALIGSPFDDRLSGDDGVNRLSGGRGSDTISGHGGDDWLDGGRGIVTSDGNKVDDGDEDSLDGGSGRDECVNGEKTTDCETDAT